MDTPCDTPGPFFTPQGPTGGGSGGLSPLASGATTQEQATPEWDQGPLPSGDARGGNKKRRRTRLCLEGGDRGTWDAFSAGRSQEGGGLGPSQDFSCGGPLPGDREWSDAQVSHTWSAEAMQENGWLEIAMAEDEYYLN